MRKGMRSYLRDYLRRSGYHEGVINVLRLLTEEVEGEDDAMLIITGLANFMDNEGNERA